MVGDVTVRGACDSHVHVYDQRYPISPSAVLTPPDASLVEYRTVQAALGVDRVVFVQPTTYGLENRCQLEAAAEFGDAARAVVVVDDATTENELTWLTSRGGRGARFHMLPGGAVPWEIMHTVAELIAGHGWHIQLQLNGRELAEQPLRCRFRSSSTTSGASCHRSNPRIRRSARCSGWSTPDDAG